jgi:hypothetical protein
MDHHATCPHSKGWSTRNNPVPYHGPSGDVNDPEVQAAVAKLRAMQQELGL